MGQYELWMILTIGAIEHRSVLTMVQRNMGQYVLWMLLTIGAMELGSV